MIIPENFFSKKGFASFMQKIGKSHPPNEVCQFVEEMGKELQRRNYSENLIEICISSAKENILSLHREWNKVQIWQFETAISEVEAIIKNAATLVSQQRSEAA